ncbi:hypothetical protein ABK040_007082 [Willaertia magna]
MSSDLSWEDEEIEATTTATTNTSTTTTNKSTTAPTVDDWEEFDLTEYEQKVQEEKKRLEEEEKLRKQQQKEQKEKEKAAKQLLAAKTKNYDKNIENDIKKEHARKEHEKKQEGMYHDYIEKKSSYDEVVDIIGGETSEFAKPKIELLQPKTEKEFQEFGKLVSDKLREFEGSKFYNGLLKQIIEQSCENVKSDFIRDLLKYVTNLSNRRLEEEKEMKNKKQTSKKTIAVERDLSASDPFADLSSTTGGGTGNNWDANDDFM